MKIKTLALQTGCLKTMKEFYSSVLELPVQEVDENKMVTKVGPSNLVFTYAKEESPFYHFAINIPSNKIVEAKEWLTNKVKLLWMKDYKSDIADFINWHAKSVYFFDPEGNILELIARHDLKNEDKEFFSSKQLLSVNEVGLVFKQDEFDRKISELKEVYSLAYFDKQPPLTHFRAIGDDEGLLVAVPQNRNWYPTDKPAGIFAMTLEFENNHETYRLELP